MSSAKELSEIYEELQSLPADLQRSITSKFAKLTGLKQFTGENAIQRDGQRLDSRQRAYYRKMGLDVQAEDDPTINNILADNITLTREAPRNVEVGDGSDQKPLDAIPVDKPQPPPAPPVAKLPTWSKWLMAALIGSNIAGAGGITAYMLNKQNEVNIPDAPGGVFDFKVLPPQGADNDNPNS